MRILSYSAFFILALFLASMRFEPAFAQPTIKTSAKFAILIDADSGAVLMDKNADETIAPASMSKIMTMIVVFEELKSGNLKLSDSFTISENAWRMRGSRMYANLNDNISLENLIKGVAVQSGNDASVALAEGIAGTEEAFADMMTKRAAELGWTKSTFTNSTGWPDPNHRTTARELAQMAQYTINELSEFYPYYGLNEFTWNKIRQFNRNPLLRGRDASDGLKTGYTEESGYGLVASSKKDGRRLILVVGGLEKSKDRAREARKIMGWGFRAFQKFVFFKKDSVVGHADVWGGSESKVPLIGKGELAAVMSRQNRKNIKAEIVYKAPLAAPVMKGDKIAHLELSNEAGFQAKIPLYAAKNVEKGNMIGQAIDTIKHILFSNLTL